MSNIIADLEKGAVVLVHDLTEPPADGSALPEALTQTVETFAGHLGIPKELLGDVHRGWLFDLMNIAVESVSGGVGGHAHAGATDPSPGTELAAGGVSGAETPPETVRVSEPTQAELAAESQQVPPLNPPAPEHGPADVDLPPVTEPDAGYIICSECNGFRTVIVNGVVSPCPKCKGAGQVLTVPAA